MNFIKALIDDITGKDANGRNAKDKKQYSFMIITLLAAATIATAMFAGPVAIVPGAILAWKIKLHVTNEF